MAHSDEVGADQILEALRVEYAQVCNTFRTLTEIRFKLLAFLPLAAGVTTAFVRDSAAERFLISLFGLATTVGIATYNARNDQLYGELVGRAAEIERRLGLADGAFANRPRAWLTLRFGPIRHEVGHRLGVGIIYAASFGLWLYGILAPSVRALDRLAAARWTGLRAPDYAVQAVALAASIAVVLSAWRLISGQRTARGRDMAEAAARAVAAAKGCTLDQLSQQQEFVDACALLAGVDAVAVRARIRSYVQLSPSEFRFYASPGSEAGSIVALLTDMPPRWINDCATSRRKPVKRAPAPP